MKNQLIMNAWDAANPDAATKQDVLNELLARAAAPKKDAGHWKRLAPMAACFVLVAAAALTLPRVFAPVSPPPPDPAPTPPVSSPGVQGDHSGPSAPAHPVDAHRGLPSGDYTWTEGDTGVASSRLFTGELQFLMREFGDPRAETIFAIVRVERAERGIEKNEYHTDEIQTAVVTVLDGLPALPEGTALTVCQRLYGGCTGEEETNLIRVGGVYVLPLVRLKESGEEPWSVYGDLDALFEVDDAGLLHSHSLHEGLSRFDGQPTSALWAEVEYLSEHPVLTSRLAEYMQWGFKLELHGNVLRFYQGEWYSNDENGWAATFGPDGTLTPNIAPDAWYLTVYYPFAGLTRAEFEREITFICKYYDLPLPDFMQAEPKTANPNSGAVPTPEPATPAVPSVEDALALATEQYAGQNAAMEFRAVSTLWESTDVYLFSVTFGDGTGEYAAIVMETGAFLRLEELEGGGFAEK